MLTEIGAVGDSLKAHLRGPSCGSTMAPPPASEIIGTLFCAAISTTVSEVGVTDGPTITSTLSSVISRVAFLAAVVGSELSFNTATFTFCPPISAGHNFTEFSAGMPEAQAAAPVVAVPPSVSQRDAAPHRESP